MVDLACAHFAVKHTERMVRVNRRSELVCARELIANSIIEAVVNDLIDILNLVDQIVGFTLCKLGGSVSATGWPDLFACAHIQQAFV